MCEASIIQKAVGGFINIGFQADIGQKRQRAAIMDMEAKLRDAENARRQAIIQGKDATQRGEFEAARVESEGRRAGNDAAAQIAASGMDLSSSTVGNIPAVSRINAGVDAQVIRATAARQAWGMEQQAEQAEESKKYIREAGILQQQTIYTEGTANMLRGFTG